jgi:hypothetical protein
MPFRHNKPPPSRGAKGEACVDGPLEEEVSTYRREHSTAPHSGRQAGRQPAASKKLARTGRRREASAGGGGASKQASTKTPDHIHSSLSYRVLCSVERERSVLYYCTSSSGGRECDV